jgi:hypothetical protein
MTTIQRTGQWSLVLLAALAAPAFGDINLEFRVNNPWEVGDTVPVGLYAVADSPAPQSFSAIRLIFAWDPIYLDLLGRSQAGAVALLSSGFPSSSWGLNEVVPPQDGDGLYQALANFGQPVWVNQSGVLVTTLQFQALAPTGGTLVDMWTSGGTPAINTLVVDGQVPGLDVTGTLTGRMVEIIPEPVSAVLLLAGAAVLRRRG